MESPQKQTNYSKSSKKLDENFINNMDLSAISLDV